MKNFKVTDITSHRNGVGGRSFYSVRFSYNNEGQFMPNMVAVMPEDVIDHKSRNNEECFVLDLNNPTSNWRGDDFASDVRTAIKTHNDDLFGARVATQ